MWEQLANFHFIRPYWLLAVIPLAFVSWLYARRRLKAGNWSRVCDDRLLPFILIGREQQSSPERLIALLVCGLLLIIALAGPAWVKLPQPVFRSQSALVIVLDLSRSMDVSDIKPSRLARARHKILDILDKRREGQTALIVYAAEPFVVTPLTEDTKTVATLVKDLTTDLMPFQGSYAGKALRKAVSLFKQASIVNGHILLVTDGLEPSGINEAINDVTNNNYHLSVLGIGTEQGAPIADRGGGFVKDATGSIVLAQLDEQRLRQLARDGRGIYRKISADDRDLDELLKVMTPSRIQDEFNMNDDTLKLQSDQWREEGPWLLLILLPFAALVFRRGYLVLMLFVLLPLPQSGYALEWSALWQNKNQRAAAALEQGDSKTAAEMFTDPQWRGAASYRAGDFQKAIESLDGMQQPDALYNKGNALAKTGNLPQAIEAYNEALKLNPEHEDAKYNRDLLQRYLEQQQQKEQQQQHKEQQQQNNNQSQNSENNQQSSSSSQDQQSVDQQAQGSDKEDQQQNAESSSQQERKDQQHQQDEQQQANNRQSGQDQEQQQAQAKQQSQGEQDKNKDKDKDEDKDEEQTADTQAHLAQNNGDPEEDPQTRQRTEQWLRRIPDDPGGLLRRKFLYQSQINQRQAQGETKPW